jgi:hypothetical protein
MADIEWQPLPPLWPAPAVWTDVGDLMLLVYTQDGVPTWEVRRAKPGSNGTNWVASGDDCLGRHQQIRFRARV